MNPPPDHQHPPGGHALAGRGPDAASRVTDGHVASAAASGPTAIRTADGSCMLCHGTLHYYGYGSGAAEPCQLCIGRAS
jgi:hypothetical protein